MIEGGLTVTGAKVGQVVGKIGLKGLKYILKYGDEAAEYSDDVIKVGKDIKHFHQIPKQGFEILEDRILIGPPL